MKPTYWLALDQGGQSSRALVYDAQGQLVSQHSVPIHTHRAQTESGERVEHDALEILQSLQTCIARVVHDLGADAAQLVAAGLATQRSSIVCWHRQSGAALSPVLSWQDRRQQHWLEELKPQQAFIEHTTGLVLSAHYGASKLRWCLLNLPRVQAAWAQGQLCMGPLSSYLLHGLLTQHPVLVDPANASRTQLWSPDSGQWSEDLLALYGVPRDVLPTCVPTQHRFGTLGIGAHSLPMIICTGDQATVPFAAGPLDSGTLYINMGTGAFALAPLLDGRVDDAAPLLRSVLWSDQTRTLHALEGTVNGAASALAWLKQQGLAQEAELTQVSQWRPENLPEELSIPLLMNAVGGLGSPYWRADLHSEFMATDASTTPLGYAVATLESIVFLLLENLTLMRQKLPALRQIVVGGGLAQNNYVCAALADLAGLPVQRLAERELTGQGLFNLMSQSELIHATSAPRASAQVFLPTTSSRLPQRYRQWQTQLQARLHRQ